MHYFELHIGDYLADAGHISLLETGVYFRLLLRYYKDQKPLPVEFDDVCDAIACRSHDERNALQRVLRMFFTLEADGHHQKRADETLAAYRAKSEKARDSANCRWKKGGKRPRKKGDANALRPHCDGNAKPITNNQEPILDLLPSNDPSQDPNLSALREVGDARKNSRGTRMAKDWELPTTWLNWALIASKGKWSEQKVLMVSAKFRDHWLSKPGAAGVKADWEATWRNWVRGELDREELGGTRRTR